MGLSVPLFFQEEGKLADNIFYAAVVNIQVRTVEQVANLQNGQVEQKVIKTRVVEAVGRGSDPESAIEAAMNLARQDDSVAMGRADS